MTRQGTFFAVRLPRKYALAAAVLLAGTALVQPAHAGAFEWVDEMFTFREDQKPRVAPRRTLPPQVVTVPDLPENSQETWSNYYTRQDLTPQSYLDGSGSKVMRPAAQPITQDMGYGSEGDNGSGPTYVPTPRVTTDNGAYGAPGAPQLPAATTNIQVQTTTNITIGTPADNGTAELGQATKIGTPVEDWRHGGAANNGFAPRPGDFDYKAPLALPGHDDGGETVAGRSVEDVVNTRTGSRPDDSLANAARAAGDTASESVRNDPRYVGFNRQGQVTKYKVQTGDSLTGIAGQKAIYDNWKLWPLIYSANRKAIGRDPENLSEGEKLGIPRGYTRHAAQVAESLATRQPKAGTAPARGAKASASASASTDDASAAASATATDDSGN